MAGWLGTLSRAPGLFVSITYAAPRVPPADLVAIISNRHRRLSSSRRRLFDGVGACRMKEANKDMHQVGQPG